MKIILSISSFILLTVYFSSCTTNIYLVRHAEKLNKTDTSSLTTSGQQRAIALSEILIHKNIDAIYTSKYVRTQQTAQPLALALHKQILIYSLDSIPQFSEQLKKLKRENVLVVGHSTNIPVIIKAITNDSILLPENDFDNLYQIRIRNFFKTKATLISKTYGAVSP